MYNAHKNVAVCVIKEFKEMYELELSQRRISMSFIEI